VAFLEHSVYAYVLSFPRHNDLLVDNRHFLCRFYPSQSRSKPLQRVLLETKYETYYLKKLDSMGCYVTVKLRDHAVSSFETIPTCVGQTD